MIDLFVVEISQTLGHQFSGNQPGEASHPLEVTAGLWILVVHHPPGDPQSTDQGPQPGLMINDQLGQQMGKQANLL